MKGETMKKEEIFEINGDPQPSIAYLQWRNYFNNFIIPGNVIATLKQNRDFFYGIQYDFRYATNTPKPCLNLCKEGAERIAAKITGTKRHISFVADKDDEALTMMDNFYEFQTNEMDDETTIDDLALAGIVDGTSVVFTSFDEDTIGTEGLYKGFLKRSIVPFERTFWSNPWTTDPQDQRYCGYYLDMEIGAAKELVEGSDEGEIEWKRAHIVPENFFSTEGKYQMDKVTDSLLTRVYIRFFRLDGEVYFDVSTQYVTLTDHPHALNPKCNESKIKKIADDMKKALAEGEDPKEGESHDTQVTDYKTDQGKYVLYTKAVKQSRGDFVQTKDKFSRYPVSVFIPYPVRGCILGQSFVGMIVPNQKIINYIYLLVTLIMQNHAMPKILAKPEALGDQQYDTTPNQIITDYSSIQSLGGVGWGITRLGSGDAVNSNLIEIGERLIAMTRKIFGFDSIESNSFSADASGYAISQTVKQMNLTLEMPQKKLWRCIKEMARTDIMYFKHYVDKAKYFEVRSESQMELNENYRVMEQNLIDAGKSSKYPKGTILPKSRRFETREIGNNFFDAEFNVSLDVEQGIAGSELTESQHFNQLMQYVAQGNIAADMLKVLVQNDPAISQKTRAKMAASLEALENSQLAIKDQQIQALQQAVQELQSYMKFSQQTIQFQQKKIKATEAAAAEQNRVAAQLLKSKDQPVVQSPMSESEVKSMNAKGISGGSFTEGEGANSIYNTEV